MLGELVWYRNFTLSKIISAHTTTFIKICFLFSIFLFISATVYANVKMVFFATATNTFIEPLLFSVSLLTNHSSNTNCSSKDSPILSVNPWFITGFCDAESSFNIMLSKSSSTLTGWRVQVRFIIELNAKDELLLRSIQSYFNNIGSITLNSRNNSSIVRWSVVGIKDISNYIIPHFNNYPLQSVKKMDYDLWRKCVEIMLDKKHLNSEGLQEVVYIKSLVNKGLSDNLDLIFNSNPDYTELELKKILENNNNFKDKHIKPTYVPNIEPLDPNWVNGFIAGDGSFYISTVKKNEYCLFTPFLAITLLVRDKLLIEKIKEFFSGVGSVYIEKNNLTVQWKVFKLDQILTIVSHFEKYPLLGFKLYNYNIWLEIVNIINKKNHLSAEGQTKILELLKNLNKWN